MKIETEEGDSEGFIELVNKLMAINIFQWRIDEIMNIRIKNWFDHKWLNYSGKAVVSYDFGGMSEFDERDNSALEDQWKEKITFPPFHPNRVLSEQFFRKRQTDNKTFERIIHKKQRSFENQQNRVIDRTNNGLYVWYSSNSELNQQGSLMMYRVDSEQVHSWYASFINRTNWELSKTKGIPKSELQLQLEG
ncbi:MAG: hypothetical protein GY816_24275 [Cytophagales bacterium]|nr:hypothetical protein [Cytophagales bacterium]